MKLMEDDNNVSDDEMLEDGVDQSLQAEAAEYAEKIQRRGVIYISRIPPFMKPNKVRSCFEVYGEVTRLYLGKSVTHYMFPPPESSETVAEEDAIKRKRRKTNGGNGSKQFTEGSWVTNTDFVVTSMFFNCRLGGIFG
jgi:hypothetical protein